MSIESLIQWKVAQGALFPLRPRAAGETCRRAMFLTEGLWNLLHTTHPDDIMEARVGTLLADLETFVIGDAITPKYLFLLAPARDGVWEIRSARPDPSIRVLGLFADQNVFIATNFALRGELGGWESREWKEAKRMAVALWRQVCLNYRPILSTNVHDLVTGAIDGRYFRE